MKRIILSLILAVSVSLSLCANGFTDFFKNRFFEINIGADLGLSTNTFELGEFLKENVVIDLRKIADDMPGYGLSSIVTEKTFFNAKLQIPHGLIFSVDAGQSLYFDTTISKDIFNFLGYGNNIGDDLNISLEGYTDAFLYASTSLGWQFEKASFLITPTAFLPLFHGTIRDTYASFTKGEDNSFNVKMNANMDIYSFMGIKAEVPDFQQLLSDTGSLFNSIGYDLSFHIDMDAFQYLSLYFDTRIPIYPGHLSVGTPVKASFNLEKTLKDLTSDSGDSAGDDLSKNPDDAGDSAFKYAIEEPVEIEPYSINRPMKFFLGGKFHPFQEVMYYYGGLGVGFTHPFAADKKDTGFYMEYLLGMHLSCANIINFDLTTEYTDKIFIHRAQFGVNLRFIEVDAGVASESADFVKSFKAAGLGAFVNACIGF